MCGLLTEWPVSVKHDSVSQVLVLPWWKKLSVTWIVWIGSIIELVFSTYLKIMFMTSSRNEPVNCLSKCNFLIGLLLVHSCGSFYVCLM